MSNETVQHILLIFDRKDINSLPDKNTIAQNMLAD